MDPQGRNCRTTRPVKSATTRPLSFWAILISPGKQEKPSPRKEFSTPGIWDISDRWTGIGHCIYPAGEVEDHIAAYKRPLHVEIWPAGEEFPLTRSTEVDKIRLMEKASAIIKDLRQQGKWDGGQTE